MAKRGIIYFVLFIFKCVLIFPISNNRTNSVEFNKSEIFNLASNGLSHNIESQTDILKKLNSDFLNSINDGDSAKARILSNTILINLTKDGIDSLTLSNSRYYLGVYYLLSGRNMEAINWLKLSILVREQLGQKDETLVKSNFNLGVAFHNLGDFISMEKYTIVALEEEKALKKTNSNSLILSCLYSLITAKFGLNEYDMAIKYGEEALKVMNEFTIDINSEILGLYANIGISYARLSDYSKALLFFEKAEIIYNQTNFPRDDNYINLLNNLAATYFFLGMKEKSDEYFQKGLELAKGSDSFLSMNFIHSLAAVLGQAGKADKGEELIRNSLEKAEMIFGKDSKRYFEVLNNYANYLRSNNIDLVKSLNLYKECIDYINLHQEDVSLKNSIMLGYALTLTASGESWQALGLIQQLLFSRVPGITVYPVTDNPEIAYVEPNLWSIDVLKAKYKIIWDIYKKSQDFDYLKIAAQTAEMIVGLLEKVRINISEEESRLVLGDRYRDAYLFAIRDFEICYEQTGNPVYLEKAFEYSEKSKVAGLLASTRELKATQFNIPENIADLERQLKSEISFYNARIAESSIDQSLDNTLADEWKGRVFAATRKRDSLITVFERDYPGYYQIKYNTQVIKPDEIPVVAGRNTSYINYVVSDTVIYIFLTNRKFNRLVTVSVDSSFFSGARKFRNLLSMPLPGGNAKTDFLEYQKEGVLLYNTLIEPVRKYIISDKLLISSDNILSYIPFEIIPVKESSGEDLLYSEIPYLMNEFRISYTYSATVLAESARKAKSFSNSAVAFAPLYTGRINIDSLMFIRETGLPNIQDLPFARQEAEFVSRITGGKLFKNNEATEASFKAESGRFDIIHLAMHTVLNDEFPMYSKMLFYQENDSVEDGSLNTYEVYDLPLKAKMVILSSCNTGSGSLNSGEGILSLARGFIYSGSQSVVMAMWEIEDRTGTEIVRNFYRYLKRGASKSAALRKARVEYLKHVDMLRAHPYFWATLVIYGNDSPLYRSWKDLVPAGLIILIITLTLFVYFYRLR